MKNSPTHLNVSVIVPVYNGGEKFRRCLESLKKTFPPPLEIIVVADGDTDGSSELAETLDVQMLRLPTRTGPAQARNVGARKAQGEILFFIDADVTVPHDLISRMAMAFEREPDIAAVFGSYDDEPGEANFLSQYRNLVHHYVHQQGCEDASTFWGACGAIRRNIFESIGGFDERYLRPSVEDIELGYRLRKAGYRIRLCKHLQVKHLKRWDAASMLRADVFQRAVPWTEIILKERNCINDLNTETSQRVSVLLIFLLLGSLILSFWNTAAFAAAGVIALILLLLNASIYRFFLKKKGLRFSIHSIAWHWFYFFYSGVGFALGSLRHTLKRSVLRKECLPIVGREPLTSNRGWSHADEP